MSMMPDREWCVRRTWARARACDALGEFRSGLARGLWMMWDEGLGDVQQQAPAGRARDLQEGGMADARCLGGGGDACKVEERHDQSQPISSVARVASGEADRSNPATVQDPVMYVLHQETFPLYPHVKNVDQACLSGFCKLSGSQKATFHTELIRIGMPSLPYTREIALTSARLYMFTRGLPEMSAGREFTGYDRAGFRLLRAHLLRAIRAIEPMH